MDKLRAEFEKRFPVPEGLSFHGERYKAENAWDSRLPCYNAMWEGYQACAESLRAELASERAANAKLRNALIYHREKWKEIGDDYPGSSCQEWCYERIKDIDRSLGEAIPVQPVETEKIVSTTLRIAYDHWVQHGSPIKPCDSVLVTLDVERAVAADRKLLDGLMR